MAITIPSGFIITTNEPVDNRLLLTKSQMASCIDARMPDKYVCVCKDDGKLYIYDKSIVTPSAQTGKFKLYDDMLDIPKPMTEEEIREILSQAI